MKGCECDQQCTTTPVTACIRGINDNPTCCDQYIFRWAALGWGGAGLPIQVSREQSYCYIHRLTWVGMWLIITFTLIQPHTLVLRSDLLKAGFPRLDSKLLRVIGERRENEWEKSEGDRTWEIPNSGELVEQGAVAPISLGLFPTDVKVGGC